MEWNYNEIWYTFAHFFVIEELEENTTNVALKNIIKYFHKNVNAVYLFPVWEFWFLQ